MQNENEIAAANGSAPLRVVLFRSLYESNVGSVSRVMSNMGIQQLLLVDRKCALTFKAQQAAATGQEGLRTRIEFPSLASYLAASEGHIRIALTCREGKNRKLDTADGIAESLAKVLGSEQISGAGFRGIDLLFGPEDAGLSSEEIDASHFSMVLETFGENSSLNLSHAVLLALYSFKKSFREHSNTETNLAFSNTHKSPEDKESYPFPETALKSWLSETGFDVVDRPINAFTVIKRVLMRAVLTAKEKRVLDIAFHQGIRKMKEYNQLRKNQGLPAGYSGQNAKSKKDSVQWHS